MVKTEKEIPEDWMFRGYDFKEIAEKMIRVGLKIPRLKERILKLIAIFRQVPREDK